MQGPVTENGSTRYLSCTSQGGCFNGLHVRGKDLGLCMSKYATCPTLASTLVPVASNLRRRGFQSCQRLQGRRESHKRIQRADVLLVHGQDHVRLRLAELSWCRYLNDCCNGSILLLASSDYLDACAQGSCVDCRGFGYCLGYSRLFPRPCDNYLAK